jgi:hypothetical protein
MTKTPKEKGEERKKLSDEINDLLLDYYLYQPWKHKEMDWTHLTTRQLRETKKRLEGLG